MVNKKIMILGASILQLPAILKSKSMGLQVIAVDMDKNAIGFKHSDVCLNISTVDIPKVIQAAKEFEINGIFTLASDKPMRTVAAVSEELNIIGINRETAINVTNKAEMRKVLREKDVPVPAFFKIETWSEYISAVKSFKNRFIVKPADNSGSRGIFLIEDINNKENIAYAFNYSKENSHSGEIVVEEFMNGREVSVETLSFDGNNHIIAITDKVTTGPPKFVEMGHSIPSQLSNQTKAEIEKVVSEALNAVGLTTGPSHTEVIITEDGPKIVELGARLGGDNITTHLVPLSTGVDMVRCCIEIAMGKKPFLNSRVEMGSAIQYFNQGEGIIRNIKGLDDAKKIPGVEEIYFMKNINDKVVEISSSVDRLGYVIAKANTATEAIDVCEKARKRLYIDIQKPEIYERT
ncbi:ATP-grasp domain-containing protein [Alkalihalobacillus deserti]|uniref:ATP-grasp domain-containing protein n=1 Tax=Alkalihalobacillus deserti TaxID=2879466 RepID=UPI001D1538FA|nr:ATP-grasp domain-containing protein [Alkalihalobacillus deserti]